MLASLLGWGACLPLGVLTVFLSLLLGLIGAPRPPVPLVSGPLSSKPDLPPGQRLVSDFLCITLGVIVVVVI